MNRFLLIILFLPIFLKAQDNSLEIFKPLENHIWYAEGEWGDGSLFKQEIKVEFTLSRKLVKVQTFSFVNEEQTEYGLRNEGIRQFDEKLNLIKFWEFDVYGNLTEGTVRSEEKNLIYQYNNGDGTIITEMWIYKDSETYDFIIGVYEDGLWKQVFLVTEFKRK